MKNIEKHRYRGSIANGAAQHNVAPNSILQLKGLANLFQPTTAMTKAAKIRTKMRNLGEKRSSRF